LAGVAFVDAVAEAFFAAVAVEVFVSVFFSGVFFSGVFLASVFAAVAFFAVAIFFSLIKLRHQPLNALRPRCRERSDARRRRSVSGVVDIRAQSSPRSVALFDAGAITECTCRFFERFNPRRARRPTGIR